MAHFQFPCSFPAGSPMFGTHWEVSRPMHENPKPVIYPTLLQTLNPTSPEPYEALHPKPETLAPSRNKADFEAAHVLDCSFQGGSCCSSCRAQREHLRDIHTSLYKG